MGHIDGAVSPAWWVVADGCHHPLLVVACGAHPRQVGCHHVADLLAGLLLAMFFPLRVETRSGRATCREGGHRAIMLGFDNPQVTDDTATWAADVSMLIRARVVLPTRRGLVTHPGL